MLESTLESTLESPVVEPGAASSDHSACAGRAGNAFRGVAPKELRREVKELRGDSCDARGEPRSKSEARGGTMNEWRCGGFSCAAPRKEPPWAASTTVMA